MEERSLPAHPFFDCSATEFTVADADQVRGSLLTGQVEPWMSFRCGAGNVFEGRPRRVVGRNGYRVAVECDDGTVHLDFDDGTARKSTPRGEFVYRGGLEQRNDGLGYMPAR